MELDPLVSLLDGRRVVALTGAGCSTESGIPDYRGPDRPPRTRPPIQHREFIDHADARRRYWARSALGWSRFSSAVPNPGHVALADLELAGVVAGVITQNVDGLHGAAGSRAVVELHGALARVRCLACAAPVTRDALQVRLLAANPGWLERAAGAAIAPDGDADLPDALVADFTVVGCDACGGTLMPDVVFFGGSVPRGTLDAAWQLFDRAEVLLVVGSSLTVFSGFRFVRRAAERGVPVAILNQGPTRGDDYAQVRVDARAGVALPRLASVLGARAPVAAPGPPVTAPDA
ncbi:MAG TPA: NAD-dependent protein deacetylase [Kofleriaceae bacterium]|nr:NAD-dependent protein deacetylase [Kofleriaceae bacterium]